MKNLINKTEKDKIDAICMEYEIHDYSINADVSIDVNGPVFLNELHLTELPLRFGRVMGHFCCYTNALTSLVGSPHTVLGLFNCSENLLTSLVGGPLHVGSYSCSQNKLTTLLGAPHTVEQNFCISDYFGTYNKLISTYSGDVDMEIHGEASFDLSNLPVAFYENVNHIKLILKYQRHFFIWNDDLTLNEENFQVLLDEIKDGLE